MSLIDLPKPPKYQGEDPFLAEMAAWAEDFVDAVQTAMATMDSRMLRNDQPVGLLPVTVAQLAAFKYRAGQPGRQVFVTDESGGAVPAFSDGTNWRRATDRNVVS